MKSSLNFLTISASKVIYFLLTKSLRGCFDRLTWWNLAIISFMALHVFSILFLYCNICSEKQLLFDFRLSDSNKFLHVSYFSSFKIVLSFRNVLHSFYFLFYFIFLRTPLIPLLVQRLKCFFCFNLSLATEKYSSYSE